MSDDDSRQKILERRAYFIRAALAGAGIGAVGLTACDPLPQPCLEPPLGSSPPSTHTAPAACLKIALPADAGQPEASAPDASKPTSGAAPSASSGVGSSPAQSPTAPKPTTTATPNPTQTQKPESPPTPRPCLKVARPPKGPGPS